MDIAGYAASVFIGIALGLIGGGGSILTVPVLVYLFGVDTALAIAYSLFIVGTTSAIGSFSYFTKKLIHIRTAIVFGIPSVIAVFLTRVYILPVIPENVFRIGSLVVTKNTLLMLFFAVLMLAASYSMIKRCKDEDCLPAGISTLSSVLIIALGIFAGIITGLIGAGGGFLIIPALVNFLGLEFKKAVGTSLFIIALNSLFGFVISVTHYATDWIFLFKILILTISGVLIGSYFSKIMDGKKLKPAFGWFVLMMGIYMILKETTTN